MTTLHERRCGPSVGIARLSESEIAENLAQLDGWALQQRSIEKTFRFADHHRTMAFVNALAWISHTEDHHPELVVTYAACRVRYDTHTVQGLSINDFICAAKVDALVAAPAAALPAT